MKTILFKTGTFLVVIAMFTIGTIAQSNEEFKSKIEKINKEMATAMISGDYTKNLSYYASDVISLPSYEKMIEGIDALKASQEEMVKMGMKCLSFNAATKKVLVNGNMITEVGTYTISFLMPGNDKPMNDAGKYVTIWEKQKDGSLKIKIETWNTDSNPWATNI